MIRPSFISRFTVFDSEKAIKINQDIHTTLLKLHNNKYSCFNLIRKKKTISRDKASIHGVIIIIYFKCDNFKLRQQFNQKKQLVEISVHKASIQEQYYTDFLQLITQASI